jgi:hypothetical protein
MVPTHWTAKVVGDKGISEMKSKQQSPCSNCMHWPVMSWGNACSTCMHKCVRCMHWPVTSQANACTYCMGSKVSSLSQIYLYSSFFSGLLMLNIYLFQDREERKGNFFCRKIIIASSESRQTRKTILKYLLFFSWRRSTDF